jgi:hypothetical protein
MDLDEATCTPAALVSTSNDRVPELPEPLSAPKLQLAPNGSVLLAHANVIAVVAKFETSTAVVALEPGVATVRSVGVAEMDAAATAIVKLAEALAAGDSASLTVTVKVYVPDCVGVPVRFPALAAKVMPGGRFPEATLQMNGPVPP